MKVPKGQKVRENSSHELQVRLGSAIKEERKRLGVTQEELAWRADMHRTYLADIERGARNVTLKSIANLAKALQVSVASLLTAKDANPPARIASSRPGEILLVEDEATDADLTLRAFKQAGIMNPVKIVRDGRQALDFMHCRGRFARRRQVQPELVLLDLHLPDMPGLEVLRAITSDERTRHIPVVILTSSREDRNIIECGRLGAENYIIKPVGFESFSKVTPKLNLQWTLERPRGGAPGKPDA